MASHLNTSTALHWRINLVAISTPPTPCGLSEAILMAISHLKCGVVQKEKGGPSVPGGRLKLLHGLKWHSVIRILSMFIHFQRNKLY